MTLLRLCKPWEEDAVSRLSDEHEPAGADLQARLGERRYFMTCGHRETRSLCTRLTYRLLHPSGFTLAGICTSAAPKQPLHGHACAAVCWFLDETLAKVLVEKTAVAGWALLLCPVQA